MAVTVNLRKMLHRKSAEYCTPSVAGNTVAGAFIVADKGSLLPANDGIAYVAGASAIYNYNADEDAWQQGPNSGVTGTFGAGASGLLRAQSSPAGAVSNTATAGTTTQFTTNLTIVRGLAGCGVRVIGGTGVGYAGYITSNSVGANAVINVSPASSVAFDNTTVYQLFAGSLWFFCPGTGTAVGLSVYDRATNTWTARSVTGLPVTYGTDGKLINTSGVTSNGGLGFVTGTSTGSNTSTTIADTGKTWPVNGWANSQVRIKGGTGAGQTRSIASNTGSALTVSSAWTVTPDATSEYIIEGNDDYIYLLGNNAVAMYRYTISTNTWTTLSPTVARAAAPGAGLSANWIDGVNDATWSNGTYSAHYATSMLKQLGRYIYSFRGGASNAIDVYDIAANTWINNISYGQQFETFTTGSCTVDYDGAIYIQKDATGRIFKFNIAENAITPFAVNPVPQGAAVAGDKMFITTFKEGTTKVNYLYTLGNTRSELTRWLII